MAEPAAAQNQGFRRGNTNQSDSARGGFFQPHGRNNSRPQTPPNFSRVQQPFQQRPVTPPATNRPHRGPGCFICGERGRHSMFHRADQTQQSNDRRPPSARDNERYRETTSGLNANARVFTPSSGNQRQPSSRQSGNSDRNPGSGNRVPPFERPTSA